MAKVLIVDDSPTEVHILKGFLDKGGHDVLVAQDGKSGIEMAEAESPDLILMDVVMPGVNGFQATRKLSRNDKTSAIPVIMVTTKNQETDRIWGMRQGAVDYLVKPVKEKSLMEKISEVLDKNS
ncbi:MAG: response regulator [Gammaproteobacteria bacterium]|nr:response regulator [Gammaproteobacteria bacterium]NNC97900.1 response regulator [Gammaproteobacteria bacterium]NNM13531.1 response regulator [Gammaproteobacteria bacterium]